MDIIIRWTRAGGTVCPPPPQKRQTNKTKQKEKRATLWAKFGQKELLVLEVRHFSFHRKDSLFGENLHPPPPQKKKKKRKKAEGVLML